MAERFEEASGRRPRILVAKLGQDGHDRGAKVIASGFADMGFDVEIGPLFQMPRDVARQAIEGDVHVVGISSQAAGHRTLVPKVVEHLKDMGGDNIEVILGGVVPTADRPALRDVGVKLIFGPGSSVTDSAQAVLELLMKRLEG